MEQQATNGMYGIVGLGFFGALILWVLFPPLAVVWVVLVVAASCLYATAVGHTEQPTYDKEEE